MRRFVPAVFIMVFLSFSSVFAAPFRQDSNIGCFSFTLEVILKNTGRNAIHSINGEIPVMAWNSVPSYQKITAVTAEPPVVWNKNGYEISFSLDSLPAGGIYKMDFKYQIELTEEFQDPPNQSAPGDYGRGMSDYLHAEDGVEVGDPQIVAVLSRLGINGCTPKEKARKIFSFVSETLDYKVDFSRDADALKALKTGWGRCEDYAMLFTALCRTAGVPARLASGFRMEPEEVQNYQTHPIDVGHMWAEAFLPSVGWVSVDPTYIAMDSGRKVTDYRFFAGFYPDDLHVFLFYGQPKPKVYYKYYQYDPGLDIEYKFYINRTN